MRLREVQLPVLSLLILRLALLAGLVSPLLNTDVRTESRASPAPCQRPWSEPVDAPIVDFFRPPSHAFGPGNRGLEYGTVPEEPVVVVADGVVRFAGPVAGSPVVVVDHGASLWSTYTGLVARSVSRGQSLRAGELVGHADIGLHLTARHHGSYLDPQVFLVESCDVVRLVDPPSP